MIPKKAKDFNALVADELNISKDLVDDVINFYWKKIRTSITNLEEYSIEIINLGTFKIKDWKIEEVINEYNKKIENLEGKFNAYVIKRKHEKNIESLEKIKKEITLEKEKLKLKKDDRKSKDNMEEQSSNT